MTSATERLRALLTERGVKWMPVAWSPKRETFYHAANGVGFCADEYTDGVKIYTDSTITPEQAIDATLGPDTDGRMSGFQWHLMVDEAPEYGTNDYVVMGTRGALHVASKYSKYSQDGKGAYFYIPNRRDNFMDKKQVLAWAEIPPLEVDE